MTCFVCQREARLLGTWVGPDGRRFCSDRCFNLFLGGRIMIDKSPVEIAALEHASDLAGEYLESLKKTDLVTLSRGEWMTLVEVIVTGWGDSKQQADGRLREDLDRLSDPPLEFTDPSTFA